jgi:hypothetical protein
MIAGPKQIIQPRIKYVLISKTQFEGFAGPNERMERSRLAGRHSIASIEGRQDFFALSGGL